MNVRAIMQQMVALGASDLHVKAGIPPLARVHGLLTPIDVPPPTPRELEEVAQQILTPVQRDLFETTREGLQQQKLRHGQRERLAPPARRNYMARMNSHPKDRSGALGKHCTRLKSMFRPVPQSPNRSGS